MIFVDTSAWFAAYVPSDPLHRAVQAALPAVDRLLTTDYILDETVTLLRARGHVHRAYLLGPRLLDGRAAQLEYVAHDHVEQAWTVSSNYRDKLWSFTDCSSFVAMKRMGIAEAITLDSHFRQMPGVTTVRVGR